MRFGCRYDKNSYSFGNYLQVSTAKDSFKAGLVSQRKLNVDKW